MHAKKKRNYQFKSMNATELRRCDEILVLETDALGNVEKRSPGPAKEGRSVAHAQSHLPVSGVTLLLLLLETRTALWYSKWLAQ